MIQSSFFFCDDEKVLKATSTVVKRMVLAHWNLPSIVCPVIRKICEFLAQATYLCPQKSSATVWKFT